MGKFIKLVILRTLIIYSFTLYADENFQDYQTIVSELKILEQSYPTICKVYDIGDSRGKEYAEAGKTAYDNYKHDIWAVKVSDNVAIEEDEPGFCFMAGHYANEPVGVEVTISLLKYFVENYASDSSIAEQVNSAQIWFIPLVNPDGHKVALDGGNSLWRKNICDNNRNGIFDSESDGVDLNRNYGFEWGLTGASDDFSNDTYHGTAPWSEPETKAVKAFMESREFVAGISYNSIGETVLFPYGYDHPVKTPDFRALKKLAQDIAMAIPGDNGNHYNFKAAWQESPCSGTAEDFLYGEHGVFSLRVTLGTTVFPEPEVVETICSNNLESALIMLNRTNVATLTGHITDANTGEPVEATIFIKDIDDKGEAREPYKSNKKFGRYFRLLSNGGYEITVSAPGYIPQTFSDIRIFKDKATILDVQLQPYATNSVTGNTMDLNRKTLQLVPLSSQIVGISIPVTTTTHLAIYNANGRLMEIFTVSGVNTQNRVIRWNTSQIARGMYVINVGGNGHNQVIRYMHTK